MRLRSVVYSGALVVPALLLASCNETSDTPAAPNNPAVPATSTAGGRRIELRKFPQISPEELAAAVKEDLASAAVVAQTNTSNRAKHDPTVSGQTVKCLTGEQGTGIPGFHGEAKKFGNSKGCELNTNDGDADPNNAAAYVVTTVNALSNKKLTQVQQLDFYYAGGPPIGGAPRITIPIDENGDGTWDYQGGTGTEGFAFIDVPGCNDGDGYVGALKGDDDPTCNVNYESVDYPTFSAFEAAFPSGRVAKNSQASPFIAIDQPNHYLIYRVTLK
jgi:hypothetical protein